MTGIEVLVALAIAVGLAGVFVPALPGTLLVAAALLVWGFATGTAAGWAFAALGLVVLAIGAVVKYVVPGRRLRDAGVPTRTMLVGAALGVVGFFLAPIIGFPIGLLLGILIMQWHEVGRDRAWPATWAAVKAIGLGMLIEFSCAFAAAILWAAGVLVT